MVDQLKNMMIGVFVLCALSIVVFIMLFLHPSIGNEKKIIKARFANIDKVSIGTRVNFAGKPIGEVTEINEIAGAMTHRKELDGYVYIYELTMHIDSSVDVYETDDISVRTSGLLGEKNISIIPLPVKAGEKLIEVKDQILYATETGSVEDTLKDFKKVAGKVGSTLDSLNDALATLKREDIWHHAGNVARNLDSISTSLNNPKDWSETLNNIHDITDRVLHSWDKVDETLNNLADSSGDLKGIMDRVSKGEGSVGKILVKDDLYLRISSLLSKAEVTLNDINHYGILYHTDKGWQRLRARRLNLLQNLCSPQEFRNYFNDELDQITTSLERVSMVMEATENPCCNLWENQDYHKVYAELLRRVEMLDEYLNMYNQQVVDHEVRETELEDNCCYY